MEISQSELERKEELRKNKAQRRKDKWATRAPEEISRDRAIANKWSRERRKKRELSPEQRKALLEYNNLRYSKNKEEKRKRQRDAYALNRDVLRENKRRRSRNRTDEQKSKERT